SSNPLIGIDPSERKPPVTSTPITTAPLSSTSPSSPTSPSSGCGPTASRSATSLCWMPPRAAASRCSPSRSPPAFLVAFPCPMARLLSKLISCSSPPTKPPRTPFFLVSWPLAAIPPASSSIVPSPTAVRSRLLLTRDPTDVRHCLLFTTKHSLGAPSSILCYEITPADTGLPTFHWLGERDRASLERLSTGPIRSSHRQAILRFL